MILTMNETTTTYPEEKTVTAIRQAMQIGRSPNDVRTLYTEGSLQEIGGMTVAGSQSIKIVPNEQSLLEQQLCENEARAHDREYAMYQRILSGRHGFDQSRSLPYLTSFPPCDDTPKTIEFTHQPMETGRCGPKTMYPLNKDSLVGFLRFNSNAAPPVLSHPTQCSSASHVPAAEDTDDDGVFDLEM
jgi:hypothetical protein